MKTYRETMQELQFTLEEKREMTDRLMAAASRPRRRTMPSLRRTAGIGVAAALVLTVGVGAAGAAGVLKTAGEAFSDVFGGAPAQTEIIDRIGYPVGASATADGVTVTADAIIGDTYSYAVVYTISRDDGAPLAEELTPNVHGYLPSALPMAIRMWAIGAGCTAPPTSLTPTQRTMPCSMWRCRRRIPRWSPAWPAAPSGT